jgi:hypothetical protein
MIGFWYERQESISPAAIDALEILGIVYSISYQSFLSLT